MRNSTCFLLCLSSIILLGCSSTGVVPIGGNTYMIAKKDGSPGVGISQKNKAEVYQEATEYCSSKHMVMKEVSVKVSPSLPLILGSTELHFRCVDQSTGDSEQMRKARESCDQEYRNNLALDPIRQYVPQFAEDATLSQRANAKRPTGIEKGALEVLDQVQTECRTKILNLYAIDNAPPSVVNTVRANMNSQRDLLMVLWSGKLTYGQYAIRRIALTGEYQSAMSKILNVERDRADARSDAQARISVAEQEAKARADAAQQAADAQSSMAATQRMMLINQQQPKTVVVQPIQPVNPAGTPSNPIQTNCSKMGNSVNCSTYSY